MPSFNRSRNERCRLGTEPIDSNLGLPLEEWLDAEMGGLRAGGNCDGDVDADVDESTDVE